MSKLEERAKPILLPILGGKPTILGQNEQTSLAVWCAMHIMVAEQFAPERAAIPDIERRYLWAAQLPPANWKIWLGNYQRLRWKGYWAHLSLAIGEEYVSYAIDRSVARSNTQTTTFVVGQLFTHAFSSASMPELVERINLGAFGAQKLVQIWPIKESIIAWPSNAMGNGDADRIVGEIFNTLSGIGDAFGV